MTPAARFVFFIDMLAEGHLDAYLSMTTIDRAGVERWYVRRQ